MARWFDDENSQRFREHVHSAQREPEQDGFSAARISLFRPSGPYSGSGEVRTDYQDYRQQRRAAGLCALCGKVRSSGYACADCQKKNRQRKAKGPMPETRFIDLSKIRIDGGTQMRAAIDVEHVGDLARAIERGEKLPPVKVFNDGTDCWLARGFHRYHAHKKAGRAKIEAEVIDGTVRDAILDAAGDNAEHNALKRTNADKRKAVETLLNDAEWSANSDRWIAETVKVSHTAVAAVRAGMAKLPSENGDAAPKTRKVKTKDGRTRTVKPRAAKPTANGEANGKDDENGHAPEAAPRQRITEVENTDEEPWARFNASVESVCSQLRTACNQLGDALGYNADTKQLRHRFAYFFSYQSTIGAINQIIRLLKKSPPVAKSKEAPGYISADVAERQKAQK
jgi:uncharacterized ParB-like nuclease family protein